MNRFTDRQKKIIKEIHNSNTFITGKSLSLILNVSLRTIQSEVSAINKVLPLILSTNRGYKIDDKLYKTLDFTAIEKEQNLEHIIVKKVFFHNPHYNIDDLADVLYISTATLEKYFKKINETLSDFDLKIIRTNNTVFVSGNELNKRKYLNKIIFDEINMRWWDYTKNKFNIGGYVCLRFSIMWGLGVVAVMKLVHPPIFALVRRLPKIAGIIIISILVTIFAIDMVVTLKNLIGIRKSLGQLDKVAEDLNNLGNQIKDVVGNSAINMADRAEESLEKLDERTEESREKWANASEAAKEKFAEAVEPAREKFAEAVEPAKEKLAGAGNATRDIISNAGNATKEIITNAGSATKEL
mgnify:CR=1 FL=1